MTTRNSIAALTASVFTLGSCLVAVPANAGILHHHPVAAGVAAGMVAHHMAKKSGRNRAAHGGHRNFAQRHPGVTGIAAGVAAHHMLKR